MVGWWWTVGGLSSCAGIVCVVALPPDGPKDGAELLRMPLGVAGPRLRESEPSNGHFKGGRHDPPLRKDILVGEALNIMNTKKITSLFICENKKPLGIVHIHDLLRLTS